MTEKNIDSNVFLSLKDLYVEYTSEGSIIKAVNGVSFDIKKGRTLGLVGETGAGKTSIAKSIIQVLPEPPSRITNGEIFIDGVDILKLSENEKRKIRGKKVSMIFQDPMTALNPVITVVKQISEGLLLHNPYTKEQAYKQAVEMLRLVGIPADRADDYPHQFSGGMKQRVVIAMALACSPELLLADEPTTALDVTIQAQVLEIIMKLKESFNTSLLLITHDLGVVAEVCDDVAVIYAGEILEIGTLEDLFDHPTHPYTTGLFGALPNMNTNMERLSPIDGLPPDPTNLPKGCSFSPRCPKATEACRTDKIPLVEITKGHFCRCIHTEDRS